MRRIGATLAACACALAAFGTASAQAGQIVYQHGGEIWVMNDDGSGQRPLLSAAQAPGMSSIGDPNVFPNGGSAVAFDATTLAYAAPAGSGPAGACGINCTGVYTLAGGAVARISPEAAPCGPAPQWCGSFNTSPAWMANGEIAYENDVYAWEYSCAFFPCSWSFSVSEYNIEQVAPTAGAGIGTPFALQHPGNTIDGRPDPADASRLSYVGAAVDCEHGCFYPLYVSTGSGTDTPVVYDDDLIQAAWSPDGTRFADVEGGGERGIWTYGSEEASESKPYVWALKDPIQTEEDPGNNPFDVTFENVAWIGNSRIAFSADYNLWSISASCGQSGAPSNPCQFPRDATQLTSDGTKEAPDGDPSWTSSTAALASPGASGPAGGGSSAPAPAPAPAPTAGAASVGAVHSHGSSLQLQLRCAGAASSKCVEKVQLVVVETLRGSRVVAIGARRAKLRRRRVVIGAGTLTLAGGQTGTLKLTLNRTGRTLLARYRRLHAALRVTQALGASAKTVKTQTVTLTAPRRRRRR